MKAHLRIELLVLLFLMVCFECVAQNGLVTKTQDLPRKNTLIRAWNADFSIGYTDNGSDQGYFFLEDIANKHLTVAGLRPYFMVSDFSVYNNRVYFCGSFVLGTKYGIVGWFDISTVFYGTGMIQYGCFPTPTLLLMK